MAPDVGGHELFLSPALQPVQPVGRPWLHLCHCHSPDCLCPISGLQPGERGRGGRELGKESPEGQHGALSANSQSAEGGPTPLW